MASSVDGLVDTSVSIPFLLTSHPEHQAVFDALAHLRLGLAGHAAFETFSVLTRLPGDVRVDAATADRVLDAAFPFRAHLSAEGTASLMTGLALQDITGGSVYDALVAAAAVEHGSRLYTRDRRALPTYRKVGADYRLLD